MMVDNLKSRLREINDSDSTGILFSKEETPENDTNDLDDDKGSIAQCK